MAQGLGFRYRGLGASGFRYRGLVFSGFRVQFLGAGFRNGVQGLRVRIQSAGFRGLGFRV